MKLSERELTWVFEVLERVKKKMKLVTERNRGKIPYTTVNGIFDDRSGDDMIDGWTNGFWGGLMWQLYNLTEEEIYKQEAIFVEEKLDKVLMNANGLDHDNGFKWLPTAVVNYKITNSEESYNRAILAANNFAGRFNLAGGFFRAWNDRANIDRRGWAIIDCMMNLPLLYWASDVTTDPRFRQMAIAHANTAQKYFVREDGSVNHIVEFDPFTGEMKKTYGGQGYAEGSSWTRGQAWALYGFVISYIHTKDEHYLNTAKRVANYVIANIPDNKLIPVDFRQPFDCVWEDSTASAIFACGLLELSKYTEERDSKLYIKTALELLRTLDEQRCCWDLEKDGILEKCTAAYHADEHEFSIIYGDYYFVEALLKLSDKEIFIW